MPGAVPRPTREEIVRRHEQGESLRRIAEGLGLSFWTVRKVWRRYRDEGERGLRPRYDRCGWHGLRFERKVYRAALWLKRLHPRWGAPLVQTILRDRWPGIAVPSERTLQRWWQEAGLNRRPQRQVRMNRAQSKEPHEVWQIDAVEGKRLASGEVVSWVTVQDEYTGAILETTVFPPQADQRGTGYGGPSGITSLLRALGDAGSDSSG
jgi:transposase